MCICSGVGGMVKEHSRFEKIVVFNIPFLFPCDFNNFPKCDMFRLGEVGGQETVEFQGAIF